MQPHAWIPLVGMGGVLLALGTAADAALTQGTYLAAGAGLVLAGLAVASRAGRRAA
jgi:hypothetical protein